MNHLLPLCVIEEPCIWIKVWDGYLIIQLTAWRAKMRSQITARRCIHLWISQTLSNQVNTNILKDGVHWGRPVPLLKHSKSGPTGTYIFCYTIMLLCYLTDTFCFEQDLAQYCLSLGHLMRCSKITLKREDLANMTSHCALLACFIHQNFIFKLLLSVEALCTRYKVPNVDSLQLILARSFSNLWDEVT